MENNYIIIFSGKRTFSKYSLASREGLAGPEGPPLVYISLLEAGEELHPPHWVSFNSYLTECWLYYFRK